MEREIKFRGQKLINNEWVYGFYSGDHPFLFQSSIVDGVTEYDVKVKTIGQYTGVEDKNGQKIYEGDIVRFISWMNEYNPDETVLVRPVEFKDGSFSPVPTHEECEDGYYTWGLKDFEVIGNIHENPELL